jgi:hypothetical protein
MTENSVVRIVRRPDVTDAHVIAEAIRNGADVEIVDGEPAA